MCVPVSVCQMYVIVFMFICMLNVYSYVHVIYIFMCVHAFLYVYGYVIIFKHSLMKDKQRTIYTKSQFINKHT